MLRVLEAAAAYGVSFRSGPLVQVLCFALGAKTVSAWLKHHRQPCCKRIPLADRLQRLYSIEGYACSAPGGGPPPPNLGVGALFWTEHGSGP